MSDSRRVLSCPFHGGWSQGVTHARRALCHPAVSQPSELCFLRACKALESLFGYETKKPFTCVLSRGIPCLWEPEDGVGFYSRRHSMGCTLLRPIAGATRVHLQPGARAPGMSSPLSGLRGVTGFSHGARCPVLPRGIIHGPSSAGLPAKPRARRLEWQLCAKSMQGAVLRAVQKVR